jgi:hypothetical protein
VHTEDTDSITFVKLGIAVILHVESYQSPTRTFENKINMFEDYCTTFDDIVMLIKLLTLMTCQALT